VQPRKVTNINRVECPFEDNWNAFNPAVCSFRGMVCFGTTYWRMAMVTIIHVMLRALYLLGLSGVSVDNRWV
jgi:hypothetical protein